MALETFLLVLAISFDRVHSVHSHGRLMDPPSRNAMWRFGYPNPVNYNDNELYCGGAAVMQSNNGLCGVCGDNYADERPRAHEVGGMYGNRIVTRKYTTGSIIKVSAELTANHLGYFQFRICAMRNSQMEVTQDCLDKHLLKFVMWDGSLSEKYPITNTTKTTQVYNMEVQLIPDMEPCINCVLQWTYKTGNSWGVCEDGTEAMGCGYQETFINCADISVLDHVPDDVKSDSEPSWPATLSPNILYQEEKASKAKNLDPKKPLVIKSQVCHGLGKYRIPGMNRWCQVNCMRYPPNCPQTICHCISSCKAIGPFKKQHGHGADLYCADKCNVYPQKNCPSDKCVCE